MTEPKTKIDGVEWEPTPGQCLLCGGRGGWWSALHRETCSRCRGGGWDPARGERWFKDLIAPLQETP